MPATATRSKLTPAKALAEYQEREREWDRLEQAYRKISRQFADKLTRSRQLHDERRLLAFRRPELVDHLDQAVGKDNRIREIDRELQKLGDLGGLEAKVEHAKRLAASAKQSAADYVASHFALVMQGRRPEAERVAADVNAKRAATLAAAHSYIEFFRWVSGVTVMAGRDPRSVPGLDAGAELLRLLQRWDDLPAPLPEVGE